MAREYTEEKLGANLVDGADARTRLELVDIKMHREFPYWAKSPDYIQGMQGNGAAVERYVTWCEILVAMMRAYGATVGDHGIGRPHALTAKDINDRAREEVVSHSITAWEHAQRLLKWKGRAEAEMERLSFDIRHLVQYFHRSLGIENRPHVTTGLAELGQIESDLAGLKTGLRQQYPDRAIRPAYTAMLAEVGGSGWSDGGDPALDALVTEYAGPNPLTGSMFQIIAKHGHRAYHEIGRIRAEYDAWRRAGSPATSQEFTEEFERKAAEDAARRLNFERLDTDAHHKFPYWARPPGYFEGMSPEEAAVERYVAWCEIWVAMAEAHWSTAGGIGADMWDEVQAQRNREVTRHSVAALEHSQRLAQWMHYAEAEMRDMDMDIDFLKRQRYPPFEWMNGPFIIGGPDEVQRVKDGLVALKGQLVQRYPDPRTRRAYTVSLAEVGRSAFARAGIPVEIDAMVVDYAGPSPLTGSLFQIVAERGHRAYREIETRQKEYDARELKRRNARHADVAGGRSRGKVRKTLSSVRGSDDESGGDDEDGGMDD